MGETRAQKSPANVVFVVFILNLFCCFPGNYLPQMLTVKHFSCQDAQKVGGDEAGSTLVAPVY
jgi:hypothetical protein